MTDRADNAGGRAADGADAIIDLALFCIIMKAILQHNIKEKYVFDLTNLAKFK